MKFIGIHFLRPLCELYHDLFANSSEELQVYCRLRSLEATEIIRQLSSSSSGLVNQDSPWRESCSASLRWLFDYAFIWLAASSRKGAAPPMDFLRQFENVLPYAQSTSRPFLLGSLLIGSQISWRYYSRNALYQCSFIHWTAYWCQDDFVREWT